MSSCESLKKKVLFKYEKKLIEEKKYIFIKQIKYGESETVKKKS